MSTLKVIRAGTPDEGLLAGLWHLKTEGRVNTSRVGTVVQAPAPVVTAYTSPRQRVMLSPLRDANPFFHLYEAIWMLAGQRDAASVGRFAATMETFAEDGLLWGAYGYRWRAFFGFDQLDEIIKLLRKDPTTRRAVLSMWSPDGDLVPRIKRKIGDITEMDGGVYASKDVPCNTHVYFDATKGVLDMTVLNRSNDIVWGCYGANVVHMSLLHEFVARAIGAPLGVYYQFSNNYHMYIGRPDAERLMFTGVYPPEVLEEGYQTAPQSAWGIRFDADQRYKTAPQGVVSPCFPIADSITDYEDWLNDAEQLAVDPYNTEPYGYKHTFFPQVVLPLMRAHQAYKAGELRAALRLAEQCQDWGWRTAAVEWIGRRLTKRSEIGAEFGGVNDLPGERK